MVYLLPKLLALGSAFALASAGYQELLSQKIASEKYLFQPVGDVSASTLNILDYGAVPNNSSLDASRKNLHAITSALTAATEAGPVGTRVLVPSNNTFYSLGNITGTSLQNVVIELQGTLVALDDIDNWPLMGASANGGGDYANFVQLNDCHNISLLGPGMIDGRGKKWWNQMILGKLKGKRPKLVQLEESTHVLVDGLTMINSPSFHLQFGDSAQIEIRNTHVRVNRTEVKRLKKLIQEASQRSSGGFPLQPEDLNTDGFDIAADGAWVHDSSVHNDDDSIAVKPCDGSGKYCKCSSNQLYERLTLTGFGASIGSVTPHMLVNCVSNITFRDIDMPQTGKGVYVKSNPSCDPGESALISNILYENVNVTKPSWYAIWIGPQQQHEPNQALGNKCALTYPIINHCPTQGCVTFNNITLRNIKVTDPLLSPGVILGNVTNPMSDIYFDNVRVTSPGSFPFNSTYQCKNAHITFSGGSTPVPDCS